MNLYFHPIPHCLDYYRSIISLESDITNPLNLFLIVYFWFHSHFDYSISFNMPYKFKNKIKKKQCISLSKSKFQEDNQIQIWLDLMYYQGFWFIMFLPNVPFSVFLYGLRTFQKWQRCLQISYQNILTFKRKRCFFPTLKMYPGLYSEQIWLNCL